MLQSFRLEYATDAGLAEAGIMPMWFTYAVATVLTQFPFYFLIAIAIYFSGLWEQKTIREELAGEIGSSITPQEYELLLREPLCGLRTVPGYPDRVAREIVNAQNELAFRKWRVKTDGGNPEKDSLVKAWRRDIELLRGRQISLQPETADAA
jgi:hypothetical protein